LPSVSRDRSLCDRESIMRRLLTRWPPRFLRTPEAARFVGNPRGRSRSTGRTGLGRDIGKWAAGSFMHWQILRRGWTSALGIRPRIQAPGRYCRRSRSWLPTRPHPAPRKFREPGSSSPNGSGSKPAKTSKESSGPDPGKPDHSGERGNCSRPYDNLESAALGDLECVRERCRPGSIEWGRFGTRWPKIS
jgi:hypothetical protein